jgi:hypothetical protein
MILFVVVPGLAKKSIVKTAARTYMTICIGKMLRLYTSRLAHQFSAGII